MAYNASTPSSYILNDYVFGRLIFVGLLNNPLAKLNVSIDEFSLKISLKDSRIIYR